MEKRVELIKEWVQEAQQAYEVALEFQKCVDERIKG